MSNIWWHIRIHGLVSVKVDTLVVCRQPPSLIWRRLNFRWEFQSFCLFRGRLSHDWFDWEEFYSPFISSSSEASEWESVSLASRSLLVSPLSSDRKWGRHRPNLDEERGEARPPSQATRPGGGQFSLALLFN